MSAWVAGAAGAIVSVASTCWLAARVVVRAPRAQLVECALISLALILRWTLDRYWFTEPWLERPTAVVIIAYALVRASYGSPYLLPLAAAAVSSLVPGVQVLGHTWLTALICFGLKDSKPLQAAFIAVELILLLW